MLPFEKRRDDVLLLEAHQAGQHVGPGIEPMPGQGQRIQLRRRDRRGVEARLRQDGFQVFPVQRVQRHERTPAAAHGFHSRLIAPAPGIGKRRRAGGRPMTFEKRRHLAGHAVAPVNHRAEHIEQQGPDLVHLSPLCRQAATAATPGTALTFPWQHTRKPRLEVRYTWLDAYVRTRRIRHAAGGPRGSLRRADPCHHPEGASCNLTRKPTLARNAASLAAARRE